MPASLDSAQSAPAQNASAPRSAAERDKASRYCRFQYALYFGGVALALAIYAVLWWAGFGGWLRDLAARASKRSLVQCLIFVPILWAIARAVEFPLDYYGDFIVERRFGLSAESFAAWLGDWGKMFGLTVVAAIIAAWILYGIIRRSSRRWYFWFWLAMLPLIFFLIFVEPWFVEPLFYKYTPLDRTHPALTARIEGMLHHAGLEIPRSRILEMNASAKTRTLNAYVSGFGRSKHVVIWDNTLRDLTPDETLSVLAHETGHYVLHHVVKEFAWDELVALGWFFVAFLAARYAVRRWGDKTRVHAVGDLASLPLLMFILTAITFLASPMYSGISRHYEHQADQYGLELTYGVVPDPNASMVRSFEVLGKKDLADPDPNALIVFWLFTHPPLANRIDFARHYRPWAEGRPMRWVHAPHENGSK